MLDRKWLTQGTFLEEAVGYALSILEGKISGVKARGRPRRARTDDLKEWTNLRDYSELKRTAEDRTTWRALTRLPST